MTEIIAIATPAIYLRNRYTAVARSAMNGREVVLLTLALFPVILVVNGLFLEGLSRFFLLENQNLDILRAQTPLWKQLLTLAILPAFMEESFFRGVLCEQFSKRNPLGAVFFSAFIFAVFHFQWQNSLAPFLFGLVLGYIYLYGGLKASIFSHFLYNFCSILFVRFISDSWVVSFSKWPWVVRAGGVKNVMTAILLIGSALGITMILRKSMKRPLPGGGAVIRKKEWIPTIALVLVYVVKMVV
ncbi:MAG: CPBP family intramembrane glutamic endopeptidase [Peptoniphilus sp.]|nr:CPBP family intramembrane glutamic endopeptidase [Peptoniphilus sp.]MDD7362532.1 CPBP family intramembrane metalloprotease [Bacillota bacterium]MDY6045069.1 CPBP family intramembrane glutamic endopeptidase [Peptoniphilus sp.]